MPTLAVIFPPTQTPERLSAVALAAEAGRPDLSPQPQLPGGYPDVSELRRGARV